MKQIIILFLIICSNRVIAQTDSVKNLNEVTIKGYYNKQPLLRAVGAVTLLDSSTAKYQPNSSLVSLVNTAPGVRMEERSPGSYRLSLRGSLLRSPFGVRNIKIYLNDFPFTDAGGNTYLNALDPVAVNDIEIYKGPEASIFGANTGGAVLINTTPPIKNQIELGISAGSFGLLHQTASLTQVFKNYRFNFTQGYQTNNGYRENSALERKYIETAQIWDYTKKTQLKAFIFYSDLNYQTPGGLTAAQAAANPRSARLATPTLPSAVTQQAAIYNQTFYGGLAQNYRINENFKHVLALFTTYTDFKNPFITNYEKRIESTIGLRTFMEYAKLQETTQLNLQFGVESSATTTNIKNFGNNKGIPANLTADDDLNANQTFAFLRLNFDISKRLLLEVGSSLNFYQYQYQSFYPLAIAAKEKSFKTTLMPKLAASYVILPNFTVRASASKGYSTPTIAEVRSSDQIINTNLQAEAGWNLESGLRIKTTNNRFFLDAAVFYFKLKDAIVRRLNTNDVEYFINAGGTKQLGTEIQFSGWLIAPDHQDIIKGLKLNNSYSYSHFRFNDFKVAQQDFTGNKLTGVPTHNMVSSLLFNFNKGIYVFASHQYTSAIPLNDANSAYANRYHVVAIKTGINQLKLGQTRLAISFGINNLFNQKYSLGNDLNAASNRFYNPAAGINYYTSLNLKI